MKKLLIIGTVWPEPTSSAAGSRMMELVRLFTEADFAITFSSIAARSDYSVSLIEMDVAEVPIRLNDSSFDDFVRDLQPDVVIFDRYFSEEQFGWRVAEVCPDAVRVLDTEDLHFLRSARKRMLKQIEDPDVLVEPQDDISMILCEPVALREIAAMYRCDLSLIISSAEMQLLEQIFRFPAELLFHLPFLETRRLENLPDFDERRNIVSIGNFLHDPNADAVRQLKSTIWPLIRPRLPEAELHVYGAYANESVLQMHNPSEGFIVKGRAEHALETIKNYRVLLAPLRFGAGIKGKLIDAMRTGTPSVTTRIGSEGLETKGNEGDRDEMYSSTLNSEFGDYESVPEVTPMPTHYSRVNNELVTDESHNVSREKHRNEVNEDESARSVSNLTTRESIEVHMLMTKRSQLAAGSNTHKSLEDQPFLIANKVSEFVDAAVKLYSGCSDWVEHGESRIDSYVATVVKNNRTNENDDIIHAASGHTSNDDSSKTHNPRLSHNANHGSYHGKSFSFWKSHSNAGFKTLSLIRPTGHDLIKKIHEISGNLSSHRAQNFIGKMLTHHTMSSTKYMSRWIEAKNKPQV